MSVAIRQGHGDVTIGCVTAIVFYAMSRLLGRWRGSEGALLPEA